MAESGEHSDTTCGSLLQELQLLWDEIGEEEEERERMLFQLQQECLEVYRRKVEEVDHAKAQLRQEMADCEAEVSSIVAVLGDQSLLAKREKQTGTLKEQLASVQPQLNELRKRKDERIKKLIDVKVQIQRITSEMLGSSQLNEPMLEPTDDDLDLSLQRLDEYHAQLQTLQQEKNERVRKVLDSISVIQELCAILGMDFFKIITEVHPSLDDSTATQSKSISNRTLERLAEMLQALYREKKQRIQKLQDMGFSLIELWNLMDTALEERKPFLHITAIIGVHEDEVSSPGALSLDNIEQAEVELERLDKLKASKVKELVMKKHAEVEAIYHGAHMEPDPEVPLENFISIIDSGIFDPSELLANIDRLIARAKEAALSRREISDKIEKWVSACEEESWLEDYNRDENRYCATRGAHINLKRAEKARITISKLPGLVDALVAKTKSWEETRGIPFHYDGVRLLDMLDEYNLMRQEKEEEKRRIREQKRVQDQVTTEQVVLLGSRPSPPNKPPGAKKGWSIRPTTNGNGNANANGPTNNANRRLSLQIDSPRANNGVAHVLMGKEGKREKARPATPLNNVALVKEDMAIGGI